MIPKIIHYCWMSSDPIPAELQQYMDGWRRILPDYEFVLWNYDRFPRGMSRWVDEAFDKKIYAFCADYIRLYALYNYGGIYLDADVEMVKDFGELLSLDTMVCGQNDLEGLELAAFGVKKGSEWVKCLLDEYDKMSFVDEKGYCNDRPMPYLVDDLLKKHAFNLIKVSSIDEAMNVHDEKCIPVLPSDFFSPKRFKENKLCVTENTHCIHHFAGSWTDIPCYEKWEQKFWNSLGMPNKYYFSRVLNIFTMRSNLWGKYKLKRKA